MGIKTLWTVLDCTSEVVDLRELRGRTVAIDLAGWVVQNNMVKGMNGKVAKPHLRNVFFRTSALINLGITPVFVLDGVAPELKRETLNARKTAADGTEVKSLNRNRLKAVMNECKFLLSTMGIQCIQSDGEGEALCARLNLVGLVDAVITDDSDVFGYGAKTVLRNFSVANKAAFSVSRLSMSKISEDLGLTKDRIVLMAIFLGCDFFPSGVPGVGKETVLALFRSWKKEWDALEMMSFWIETKFEASDCWKCNHFSHCSRCERWNEVVRSGGGCLCEPMKDKKVAKVDALIKKRCQAVAQTFWTEDYPKIVDEFVKERPVPDIDACLKRNCPKIGHCMSILVKKLAWTEEYAQERMLPLLTRWQLEHLVQGGVSQVIRPEAIAKKRTVNGVASLAMKWVINDEVKEDIAELPKTFESVEPFSLVEAAYPEMCADFIASTMPKKAPKKTSSQRQRKTNPKNQMSSQCSQAQKPITQYFSTQDKAPSRDETVSDFSDEEVSDLSSIIDDILAKKVHNMTVEMEEPSSCLVTSTPSTSRQKSRLDSSTGNNTVEMDDVDGRQSPVVKSIFAHKNVFSESVDELEDTFDRMCK